MNKGECIVKFLFVWAQPVCGSRVYVGARIVPWALASFCVRMRIYDFESARAVYSKPRRVLVDHMSWRNATSLDRKVGEGISRVPSKLYAISAFLFFFFYLFFPPIPLAAFYCGRFVFYPFLMRGIAARGRRHGKRLSVHGFYRPILFSVF